MNAPLIRRGIGRAIRRQCNGSPDRALRRAWYVWLALPAVPTAVFALAVLQSLWAQPHEVHRALSQQWAVAVSVLVVTAVPAVLFWRAHLFRCYWRGHAVPPGAYLVGNVGVWATLALSGTAASLGCLLARELPPNLIIGFVTLALYGFLWPTGRAMISQRGGNEDPEQYEEPR